MKRFTIAFLAFAFALVGCGDGSGSSASVPPSLGELSETYGCGYGFWIGNPEQTMALRVGYRGDGLPERTVELPDEDWHAVFVFGRDLYSNWCNDVISEDDPVPVEFRSYDLTGGTLEIDGAFPQPFEGGSLTVHASGLMVTLGDGTTIDLGDVTITNDSYGFLAG